MSRHLHKKIEALRTRVGVSPIQLATPIKQPDTIRTKSDYEQRVLKQYFCIWGVKDDWGTKPIKGCFSKSINERGPNSKATYKITALYMHRQADSVGLPIVLEEDEVGLYAEVPILEGIQVCNELVIRHKNGVCNNGSYGFDYKWDKMEYDDTDDSIVMKECELFEITFCTIGSQTETFGVRNAQGDLVDELLHEETDELIKKIPREHQLELRMLINRHITLAQDQPFEQRQKTLETEQAAAGNKIDLDYLTKKFLS